MHMRSVAFVVLVCRVVCGVQRPVFPYKTKRYRQRIHSTLDRPVSTGDINAHQRIQDIIIDTQINPVLSAGLCGLNGACHPVRDVQLERTTNVRMHSVSEGWMDGFVDDIGRLDGWIRG